MISPFLNFLLSLRLCFLSCLRSILDLLGLASAGSLLSGLGCGSESCFVEVDELDESHVGCISLTETNVKDAGISTGTVSDLGCYGAEELRNCVLPHRS